MSLLRGRLTSGRATLRRLGIRGCAAEVAGVRAAVEGRIGVQELAPAAFETDHEDLEREILIPESRRPGAPHVGEVRDPGFRE